MFERNFSLADADFFLIIKNNKIDNFLKIIVHTSFKDTEKFLSLILMYTIYFHTLKWLNWAFSYMISDVKYPGIYF